MVNLLFSGNIKVFDGILTCMLSILKRSKSEEPYCVYIMTMDVSHIDPKYISITDKQIQFLQKEIQEYNPANKVIKLDVTSIYQKEFANCPNETAYCSPYTLLRLFIDLIDGIPSKLLYLDVDILFNLDIHNLYDIDIQNYEYAAARDHYGKFLIHPNYINAGVLLFNMDKCRETKLFEKARIKIKSRHWTFADQDAIYHSTTAKKMLNQKFNDQKFLHKHTVVRHFSKRLFYTPYPHTANIKQWNVSMVHKIFHYYQFDDVLYEYIYLIHKFNKGAYEHE